MLRCSLALLLVALMGDRSLVSAESVGINAAGEVEGSFRRAQYPGLTITAQAA